MICSYRLILVEICASDSLTVTSYFPAVWWERESESFKWENFVDEIEIIS